MGTILLQMIFGLDVLERIDGPFHLELEDLFEGIRLTVMRIFER